MSAGLPRCLSWLRHSAHRLEWSVGGARVQFPGLTGRFHVRISGAREINFSGRQRGFDGVFYN